MDAHVKHKLGEWREAVRYHLIHPTFAEEPAYLFEPMRYALTGEGKMLRPALCLAAAEAVGGKWQDGVMVAVALEIFHTFTLIHDDIMDGDDLRRGIPTVHKAYDNDRALLSGDTLLVYVYQLLADIETDRFLDLFKAFNNGAMDVCKGQGWDMQFEQNAHIQPEQYEMMIDLKTGALIKLACELGAIIGGGDTSSVDALSRFGLLLGRAFQMQDDLLEVTSSAEAMGKSLGSDVLNEKKTWIWLDLKQNLTADELTRWKQVQRSGEISETNRNMIRTWMANHGTIERAQNLINNWIAEADALLASSAFHDTSMLRALLDLILKRKS